MARHKQKTKTPVSQEDIDTCLARAISEGDIVDFRFLFFAFSPLREDSTEELFTDKYAHLLPEDDSGPHFKEARQAAATPAMHQFVRAQLEKKGPPQLPSELLLLLADNAVRLEKYTAAAQAYELLRIRRRMMEEFYEAADAALDKGDIAQAVRGYRTATGLAYDYAAFPEPMPAVPDYHTRALMLHAQYPRSAQDCVALQPLEPFLNVALRYLLLDASATGRLEARATKVQTAFLVEFVRQSDPEWPRFAARYKRSCEMIRTFGESFQRAANLREGVAEGLADEIAQQANDQNPRQIPAELLGREIPEGEWWQYLKELAYLHPAAALFVSRQAVTKDVEIIMPRFLKDSPVVAALGLETG